MFCKDDARNRSGRPTNTRQKVSGIGATLAV
jgi:hypothetical protein